MKATQKACKGTGNAKGYGCGKLTYHRIYGLGKMCCYADWLLNSEQGKIKLEKARLKATKPRRDFEQFEKEQKHQRGLPSLLTNTRNAVHTYVKERDKGKPCISCGTPYKSNFQAGHYYKAELFSSLKFNLFNINSQCQYCNLRLEGNLNGYATNLPLRIGRENFKELELLSKLDKQETFKWDREKLNEIRKLAQEKLKELKSNI